MRKADPVSSDPRLAGLPVLRRLLGQPRLREGIQSRILEELGVTYTQYIAIVALWEQDHQTVSSLGEKLFLESNTSDADPQEARVDGFCA